MTQLAFTPRSYCNCGNTKDHRARKCRSCRKSTLALAERRKKNTCIDCGVRKERTGRCTECSLRHRDKLREMGGTVLCRICGDDMVAGRTCLSCEAGPFDPTPEEIDELCREIRSGWGKDAERDRSAFEADHPATISEINLQSVFGLTLNP